MGKMKLLLATIAVVAIGAGLWAYWRYGTFYPGTADAYVQANVVTVAAEVTGRVVAVNVAENERVAAGDVMFELDGTLYRNAVTQAQAALQSAREADGSYTAQIDAANAAIASAQAADDASRTQLSRMTTLLQRGDVAQAEVDQAHAAAALDAARAQ